MPRQEIKALTGLRGVAACWVVLRHAHEQDILSSFVSRIVFHGYLAVDVFFILSGFVMALSYKHLFADGFTLQAYGVFLGRRLARIWPLYAVAVLCYSAVFAVSASYGIVLHNMTADALAYLIPINLALIQSWGFGDSINGPSWSISTEFAAYIMFPFLMAITLFARTRLAIITGAASAIVIILLPYMAGVSYWYPRLLDFNDGHTVWPIIRCIVEFNLGVLAFRVAAGERTPSMLRSSWASWIVALAMLFLAGTSHSDIVFVLLVPIFVLQISTDRGPVAALLSCKPVHFMGVMSYGIYLVHYIFLRLYHVKNFLAPTIGDAAADVVACVILLSAATVAAFFAHHLIELPGRRMINQFVSRLEPGTARAVRDSERMGLAQVTVRPRA